MTPFLMIFFTLHLLVKTAVDLLLSLWAELLKRKLLLLEDLLAQA
jgi:hypothetical protein